MALQTSGQISLADVATEFEDAAPHSMSEFYGVADGIPASGAISLSQFYGVSAVAPAVPFNITMSAYGGDEKLGFGYGSNSAFTMTTSSGVAVNCAALTNNTIINFTTRVMTRLSASGFNALRDPNSPVSSDIQGQYLLPHIVPYRTFTSTSGASGNLVVGPEGGPSFGAASSPSDWGVSNTYYINGQYVLVLVFSTAYGTGSNVTITVS